MGEAMNIAGLLKAIPVLKLVRVSGTALIGPDSQPLAVGTIANPWALTNAYVAGALATYTDGYVYIANAAIPAGTAWAVGTSGATWRRIDNTTATFAVNTEYASPDQHGGIYGAVYRMYFGATLPSLGVINKLVSSMLHFSRDSTGARFSAGTWSDAGTGGDYIRLGHTPGSGLFINSSGCTLISGWIDYTK